MDPIKKLIFNDRTVLILRLVVGGVFIFSGFVKLMAPAEEFAELIRGYQAATQPMLLPLALLITWVELISGAFLLLGLFTRAAAAIVAVELLGFMSILTSVLVRGINLEDCGCFSAIGFKETPLMALIRDAVLFGITLILIKGSRSILSLDSYLERNEED